MFSKILIANRGEIAVRVMKTCQRLGIKTVAVYSDADADAVFSLMADERVHIGPAPASESYLIADKIIDACKTTGAEAVHPGYGPLAETAFFEEVCESCDIRFIGPSVDAIRSMGDKALARQTMKAAGVPVIPGSEGAVKDLDTAKVMAHEIGFPLRFKACAGGGGRGMRIVEREEDLEHAWHMARAEAEAAFMHADLYMEHNLVQPRHVEIQILGDAFGRIIYLGERDCSIQRRHQKLIEESPCPVVDEALRKEIGEAAVRGAQSVGYESAGTIEFLLEDGEFYFMEMNTRIQVEHPVTEMVTGIDLVKEQIRIAAGERIAYDQGDVRIHGHAVECRINAEDPSRNFTPIPGLVSGFHVPGGPGIRVDTHIYAGYAVPPYYDSLLAKLIAHGDTRQEAIARMSRALEEFIVQGIPTTIPFHEAVMQDASFREGRADTRYVEQWNKDL